MKEKFLSIIEEIRQTGISKKLLNAKNAAEVKQAINEFEEQNKDIIFKISDWDKEYDLEGYGYIFRDGEEINCPIEVVLFIYNLPKSTEEELMENDQVLIDALNAFDSKIAKAIAKYITYDYIFYLTPFDIDKNMK